MFFLVKLLLISLPERAGTSLADEASLPSDEAGENERGLWEQVMGTLRS